MWGMLLLAGLLDVTVRRDADKQTLLAEVRIRILAHALYTSTCAIHQHMRDTSAHAPYISACALHQHMRATPAHARYISTCVLHQHMRATSAHARYISTCALHQHAGSLGRCFTKFPSLLTCHLIGIVSLL